MRALLLLALSGCATQLLPDPDAGVSPPDLAGLSCSQFLACAERCIGFDECVSSCGARVRPSSEAMVNVVFACMDDTCNALNVHQCNSPREPACDACLKAQCPNPYKTCKAD